MNTERDNIRKFIIFSGIAGVFLLLIMLLLSSSIVIVSKTDQSADLLVSARRFGSSEDKPKQLKSGVNILRTGSYEIAMSGGISSTKKEIAIKSFHIHRVNAELSPQLEATKVARGANECAFASQRELAIGTVFSYDCLDASTFFKNTFGAFSKKEIFLSISPPLRDAVQFSGGVVGLVDDEDGTHIQEISAGGTKKTKLSPENGYTKDGNYILYADNTSLYLLDTGSAAVYETTAVDKKPKKFNLAVKDEDKLSERFTKLEKFENNYYLFVGDEPAERTDSVERGTFYVFDQTGGEPIKKASIKKGADSFLNFSIISKDLVFSQSLDQTLVIYKLEKNKLQKFHEFRDVASAVSVDKQLYILNHQSIYQYNASDQSTRLVFGSSKIKPTMLQNISGELVFNAYSNTEKSPVNHTYLLKRASPLTTSSRTEDILPYGDIDSPVAYMDYLGKTMYIALSLDSLRASPGGGNPSFDQAEFDSVKKEVARRLAADGITPDKYSITYGAY